MWDAARELVVNELVDELQCALGGTVCLAVLLLATAATALGLPGGRPTMR